MLITLIVMLISVYAIAPALVKQIVAKSKVKFDANTITNPRDDGMTIQANGMITDTGPFKAIIGAMTVTVSENRADGTTAVLGSMPLAEQTVSGDTALNAFAEFSVINKPNFYAFAKSMIFNKEVSWHLEATTTITPVIAGIKLPSIPNIPFSKDLTLNAANGLQGVNLTKFDLTKSTPESIVAEIIVYIPNPSAFSIQPMGDLTFDLIYLGKRLGQVKAPNASLYFESVRRNEIFMSGIIAPPADALPAVAHMVNRYLTGQSTTVQAVAGPNASTIVAFARGMEGLTLDTIVPPLTIDLIQEMTFTKMGLTPHKTLPQADLSLSIDLRIYSPLGENSPMTINTMAMTSDMKFISKTGQMLTVGSLTITSTPVKTRCNPPKLACLLYSVNVSTTLMLAEGPAYGQFVTDFLAADTMQVYVVGTANVTATYALGDLAVSGIKVNAMANLKGLQGLNTTKVESLNIDGDWNLPPSWGKLAHREVHALRTYASQRHDQSHIHYHGLQAAAPGLKGELAIIKASMFNPSITTVNLPAWRMDIQYAATHGITATLGSVWPIDSPDRTKRNRVDLTLVPGLNTLYFMGFLLPNDAKAAGEFFSGYMDGQNFATTLVFPTNSTDRSGLAQTLSSMTLSTIVPGVQNAKVLRGIAVRQFGVVVNSKDTQSGKGQVTADFALPSNVNFPITIQSTSMEVDMTFEGVTMAKMTINAPVSQTPGAPGSGITASLVINFAESLMRVADEMKPVFNKFAAGLMNTPLATVKMNGNATATTKSEMGTLSFKVPFEATITLDGLNGFKDAMTIEKVDIVAGSKDAIVMEIDIGIQNPSRHVTIDVPDATASTIQFDMKYTGVGYKVDGSPLNNLPPPTGISTNIGTVTITNFKLTAGRNEFRKARAVYRLLPNASPADRQNGREFLSRFVNQVPIIKIEVVGMLSTGHTGTVITFLDRAFREFRQGANVPGLPQKEPLIRRYMLNPLSPQVLGGHLPTKIRIANQFSTTVAIIRTDLYVYKGVADPDVAPLATMRDTWTTEMEVPRQTTKVTEALPVTMNVFGAFGSTISTLFALMGGGTELSVMGQVTAKIGGPGGFEQELDFVSSKTPACQIALFKSEC